MKIEIPNEKKIIKIKEINEIKVCNLCYLINIKNKWVNIEKLIQILKESTFLIDLKKGNEEKVKEINLEHFEFNQESPIIIIKAIFDKEIYEIELEYKITTCEKCKKSEGTYHEAVIQLRDIDERIINKLVNELIKKEVFIKERIDKKEGIDLKVTDKKAARNIANKLAKQYNLEYKLTSKLITYKHDKGKEVYRDFILLRKLPTNFVYYKGKFWKIENKKLVDLEKKEIIEMPKDKTLMEEVEIEELEKIGEDKEGSYFIDKDYNTYYFKAKKALKLKKGQKETFYLEN